MGEGAGKDCMSVILYFLLPQCCEIIENSMTVARALADDVDLHLMMHDPYGKGFMKKCRISPDAYIQMALQLAYYRVCGCLRNVD